MVLLLLKYDDSAGSKMREWRAIRGSTCSTSLAQRSDGLGLPTKFMRTQPYRPPKADMPALLLIRKWVAHGINSTSNRARQPYISNASLPRNFGVLTKDSQQMLGAIDLAWTFIWVLFDDAIILNPLLPVQQNQRQCLGHHTERL